MACDAVGMCVCTCLDTSTCTPTPVAVAVACDEEVPSFTPQKAGAPCGHERKQTRRSATGTDVGSHAVPRRPCLIPPRTDHSRRGRPGWTADGTPHRYRRVWRGQGITFRNGDRHRDGRRRTGGCRFPSATAGPQQEAAPKGGIPGDGTFLVGKDIQAGTYRSEGKNTYGCYWARLSDTTGESSAIIANGSAQGPAIVKIAAGDKAFQTTDCKPWKKIG